jgi:hypothetical protein
MSGFVNSNRRRNDGQTALPLCALLLPLLYLSVAEAQQYPIMDMIADKLIQK